jgi:hypothetical protein
MKSIDYLKIELLQLIITVVQKLNQGTLREIGVIFPEPLFCDTFFWQKKYQKKK